MTNYKTNTKLHRIAGNSALLAGFLALASAAVGVELLSLLKLNPPHVDLLAIPANQANLVGWSFALSCLGNYLLLIPLAIYLWVFNIDSQPAKKPMQALVGLCGIGYLALGSVGAILLATSWPQSITTYQLASATDQALLAPLILSEQQQIEAAYQGNLQNALGVLWFAGIAWLHRHLPKLLVLLTWLLACTLAATSLGGALDLVLATQAGLAATVLLTPIWAIYMGWHMQLKSKPQSPDGVAVPETR